MEALALQLVLSTFLSLIVVSSTCKVGQTISEKAEVYKLHYGKYVGVKQENIPDSSDLCFYTPEIGDCLKSVDFLCYGNCGQEPIISIQHERDDVFHDDYDRRLRIVNFRMMPPDDEKDEAFVIRLYNGTVVWLANGPCSANNTALPHVWTPTMYIYDNSSDCVPTTRSTSILLHATQTFINSASKDLFSSDSVDLGLSSSLIWSTSVTVTSLYPTTTSSSEVSTSPHPTCSMTYIDSTTPFVTDTIRLAPGHKAGVSVGVIVGVAIVFATGLLVGVYCKKKAGSNILKRFKGVEEVVQNGEGVQNVETVLDNQCTD